MTTAIACGLVVVAIEAVAVFLVWRHHHAKAHRKAIREALDAIVGHREPFSPEEMEVVNRFMSMLKEAGK